MSRLRWFLRSAPSTWMLLGVIAIGQARAEGEAAGPAPVFDCGTLALHQLLQLEGCPTDLLVLSSRLPDPPPRGHSMKALRDAARTCGLSLRGVLVSKSARALDRPAIVFLRRRDHGHFIVVRPIGHTGKLVQVIDPNETPDVVDAADLYASPDWTGLALIPDRPNWPARIAASLLVGALLLAATVVLRRVGVLSAWVPKRCPGPEVTARRAGSGDIP